MYRASIFIFIVSLFSAIGSTSATPIYNPYFSIQAGMSQLRVGDTDVIVTSTETDTLHEQSNTVVPEFSAGIGYGIPLFPNFYYKSINFFPKIQVALNLRFLNQEIYGKVFQYQVPAMANYDYTLSVETARLMFDGFLTVFTVDDLLSVYILGGIGHAWNRVDYADTAVPGVVGGNLDLTSRLNNGFTYEIGGGVLWPLAKCLFVFLEYRYSHFPNIVLASSGSLNNQATSIPSATFPYTSQTIALGLNWYP